jgi:hypothetical protein
MDNGLTEDNIAAEVVAVEESVDVSAQSEAPESCPETLVDTVELMVAHLVAKFEGNTEAAWAWLKSQW